jgi:peroxiredoxin
MIGDEITDQNIINKKLEDLKKGRYNEQIITILPSYKTKILTEYPESAPPIKSITR